MAPDKDVTLPPGNDAERIATAPKRGISALLSYTNSYMRLFLAPPTPKGNNYVAADGSTPAQPGGTLQRLCCCCRRRVPVAAAT